jgi:hypothetical protein
MRESLPLHQSLRLHRSLWMRESLPLHQSMQLRRTLRLRRILRRHQSLRLRGSMRVHGSQRLYRSMWLRSALWVHGRLRPGRTLRLDRSMRLSPRGRLRQGACRPRVRREQQLVRPPLASARVPIPIEVESQGRRLLRLRNARRQRALVQGQVWERRLQMERSQTRSLGERVGRTHAQTQVWACRARVMRV